MEATLQTEDSESLDSCIQKALAALYPPFQATSSTVLCQVLSVVDRCYRGDGLRYLLHFLLPAKHFLQDLQQVACSPYYGQLFRHEGWPLCLQEKVVVQLCPLDQHLLRPGDFYLLVSPPAAPQGHSAACSSSVDITPRLLLCSVSSSSHHVEQQVVSGGALNSLFSMSWLDCVNRERERRGAARLECCVLLAHGDVFRVPWEDVVYPQFIGRSQTNPQEDKDSLVKDGDDPNSSRQEVKPLPFHSDQSASGSGGEDSEGEYVELTELPLPQFYPQKGSLTQSISMQNRARTTTNTHKHVTEAHTNTHKCITEAKNTHADTQTHTNTHINSHKDVTETNAYTQKNMTETHANNHKYMTEAYAKILKHVIDSRANTQNHMTETQAQKKHVTKMHKQVTDAYANTRKDMTDTYANTQANAHDDARKDVTDTYANTQANAHDNTRKDVTDAHDNTRKDVTDAHDNTRKDVTDTYANTHANAHDNTRKDVTDAHNNTRKDVTDTYANTQANAHDNAHIDLTDTYANTQKHVTKTHDQTHKHATKTCCCDTHSSNSNTHNSNTHSFGSNTDSDSNTHLSESNTDSEGNTHSSISNTDSEGNTHSYSNVEVSSSNLCCSRLLEENFSQGSCGGRHLSPSSSPDPLEAEEKLEGTYSVRSLDMKAEPAACHQHEGGGGDKKVGEEVQGEQSREMKVREDVESICKKEEEVQEGQQKHLQEAKCRSKDEVEESEKMEANEELGQKLEAKVDMQGLTQQDQEKEEEEVKKEDKKEAEKIKGGAEEYMDEDSYFENIQESPEDSYSEYLKQKPDIEELCCENIKQETHLEDFYCENNSLLSLQENSFCGNIKLEAHPEDCYSETDTVLSYSKDSYCGNSNQKTNLENCYCENHSMHSHSEDDIHENFPQKNQLEDLYCGNIKQETHLEDSHSKNDSRQSHSEKSYCKNFSQKPQLGDYSCGNIKQKKHSDFFMCGNNNLRSHSASHCGIKAQKIPPEDFYSENVAQKTHTGFSAEMKRQPTHIEKSYSEIPQQTHSENSYFESSTHQRPFKQSDELHSENADFVKFKETHEATVSDSLQTKPKDCYSVRTIQAQPEDVYSENTEQTQAGDFYFESTMQKEPEDSYSGKTYPKDSFSESTKTQPKDCYSERTIQTQPEDFYSENTEQTKLGDICSESTVKKLPEDFYFESTIKSEPEESYSEKPVKTHPKDNYSESTIKTQPKDCYSERTIQTQPEDFYSENTEQTQLGDLHSERTIQKQPEDFYFESTIQKELDDSYLEKTLQTYPKDTYSESTMQKEPDDSCLESTIQIKSEDSYSESTMQTEPDDSYLESTVQIKSEDSYSESTMQTEPDDSYLESTIQVKSEDSYSESTKQTCGEDSYLETKSLQDQTELHKPDGEPQNQEINSEEGEEHSEEAGGRRSADHQTEVYGHKSPPVQSKVNVSAGTSTTEPEQSPAAPTVQFQSCQSSFYSQLLRSGAVCLPGTKDRGGRAMLTVCCLSPVWLNPCCDSVELLRLLLYYIFTLRKEVRALGLTVLVDARRAAPPSVLFSALRLLQEDTPGSIHTVLILVNKDSFLHLDKPASTQVEMLNSLKSLQKHVELQQLPANFGGSFIFSQNSWISFRLRVDQLTNQCKDVIHLLQKSINILQSTPAPSGKQEAELLLSRYKAVMGSILEDVQLVKLQREGGASLSLLRREEGSDSVSEEQRAAVEEVSSLYDKVDELLHLLVTLFNVKTQELSFILDFRNLEQDFSLVRVWLEEVGEVQLKALNEPADSLELLNRKQQDFKDFYTAAYDHCKRGEALLTRLEHWDDMSSADLSIYEDKVHSFWAQLQDFSQRVKNTGNNIDRAIQLYSFLDQAYGWALEGMHHLAGISMEDCTLPDKCQALIDSLEEYQQKHPPIPDSRFQEMKAEAAELQGERGLRQWSFAWSKCQETKKMFDRKNEAVLRTRDSAHRRRSDSVISRSSTSSRKSLSGLWSVQESSSCPSEDDTFSPVFSASPPTPHHTPLLRRLFRSSSSFEESSERKDSLSPSPRHTRHNSSSSFSPFSSFSFSPLFSSNFSPSSSSRKRQQLRKTESFDCPSTPDVLRYSQGPRTLSEPPRRGNTGVFIRGLEVSSTEAADQTLCPRIPTHSWTGQRPCSPRTPGTPAVDAQPRGGSRLCHIVEEMVTTEREYVRSLRYIIHHYFPEMDRADLPQGLRGKRSVIFGNLEKLLDFHSQFFLRELEACWKHPLRVPHSFLRHEEQFGLYALYSKNKPKSDALLANHGHAFFRWKQLELGDKMDLSSYLLKPIQRMSKYALLLTDLMKEVGAAEEAELTALQAATNMVKFQLRHGNDLLAMDAIRDCDVNLKEQGQLIRQDEFTVLSGRRRCQRHIFLFEELILFSKPKKMEGGLDVFIYKHSFKTADVGLTESTGDSGLRFEIWFRRRTSKNQTFILQATTADVKHTWTSDIARILWTQATRNKEMRLKEMVSMGVGNKPFLDIQPSDAAISDRAVHYIMKNKGARTRASIAVSMFDHSQLFKREPGTSDPAVSGPSSCSLLGPLNLHMYSQTLPAVTPDDSSFSTSCIEEDEQEHETSSQPSMTTESSGSSSRCFSGSTGSDSGCVSSHLQEAMLGESGPPSQPSSSSSSSSSNKQHLSNNYMSSKAATVV